ncbi:MAG: ABC transporter permease [Kiritimatiellae bacterium]|nr:ABC transporter permease [Kiritimatiellia bacterium]
MMHLFMARYIFKRLLEMLPATLGVLVLTFLLFHVVGGSPAEVVLGKNASAEALALFDARHGYDKPLFFGRWQVIRAVGSVQDEKRSELPAAGLCRVPLLYALPAGAYRVNVGRLLVGLRDTVSGNEEEVLVDGPAPLTFAVRDGWKAVTLDVRAADAGKLRLEKKNGAWLDSQFVNYVRAVLKGDLGYSAEHNQPVARILREGVGPSLALTVPVLLGGTILGVMLGMLCAAWRGGVVDRLILVGSTLLMSVNYVVWVLAGQFLLAFKLKLFPVWGFESATYLVLPVLIGLLSGLGRDVRFYRAAILDEVYKPYVRTAQAKGLSGGRVMVRHVLRNSLIPVVTYVSLSIPFLFTGSLLLESFFGIPGLGNVSLNAIHSSDMAVVRAVVLLGALLYQAVNLLADLCYGWLDPRVRLG